MKKPDGPCWASASDNPRFNSWPWARAKVEALYLRSIPKDTSLRAPAKQSSTSQGEVASGQKPLLAMTDEYEEIWTGDFIFENEWQSFRTKKERSLDLKSVFYECEPGRRKLAVKVVDIFGNEPMTIVEVTVGAKS